MPLLLPVEGAVAAAGADEGKGPPEKAPSSLLPARPLLLLLLLKDATAGDAAPGAVGDAALDIDPSTLHASSHSTTAALQEDRRQQQQRRRRRQQQQRQGSINGLMQLLWLPTN
jgi:hypothetical protein